MTAGEQIRVTTSKAFQTARKTMVRAAPPKA